MEEDFILLTPTYGAGRGSAVPKQVIRFLNHEATRRHLRGVIAGGNRNFGAKFGIAGDVIANKCQVPLLHKFEILGTPEDIIEVRKKIEEIDTTR